MNSVNFKPEAVAAFMAAENETVIKSMRNGGGRYKDDHSFANGTKRTTHIGRFVKAGKECIVLLQEKGAFSVNPLVMGSDGLPHRATYSIGGVINMSDQGSLEAGVRVYNAERSSERGQIVEIIRV